MAPNRTPSPRTLPARGPQRPFRRGRQISFNRAVDSWLAAIRPSVKESTFALYRSTVDGCLRPDLGPLPLSRIDADLLRRFLRQKTASQENPVSRSALRTSIYILRSVLTSSGSVNALRGLPAAPQFPAAGNGPRVMDEMDWKKLKRYLLEEDSDAALGVLLCMYTGLRLGEICALQWGDIDPERAALTVRRTVQRIRCTEEGAERRTKILFDTPKTPSACRRIPLPPALLEPLRRHRREPDCFVLTGRADAFTEPRVLQSRFKTMLRRAGAGDINFHALRHTFATRCVDLGVDVKALSMLLGHASVHVTLNTYVHPSMATLRKYMDIFCQSVPVSGD